MFDGWTFHIEDKSYLHEGKISVEDMMFIHEKSGIGLAGLGKALVLEGHPLAIAAWVYLKKREAREVVQWKDVLQLDIATFKVDLPEDESEKDDEDEKEPAATVEDPPSVNGMTPQLATSGTSLV